MNTTANNGGGGQRCLGSQEIKLEHVFGLTASNNSALDCDPLTGVIAYPAGCVIVLYNVRKNKQSHIISTSKHPISALSFSWDGKFLATGECGHSSHLRVWDTQKHVQLAELPGHKYGINCVAFSPNMKYVVSVGSQLDMIVNVWDWRNNVKVASNKVSCKVKAISFSATGNYFVTVGNHHVKFWYLEYSRSTKYKLEPVPLMGRSAILGDQRNNYFCDVACGHGDMAESTYAITKSGLLCEFNSRRLLDKWVELRTTVANSISVGEIYIVVGCAEGIVRCFSPHDLRFVCTLPRPHYLGVDVAKGLTGRHISSHPSNAKYPHTLGVTLDETNKKVTCLYNDHSIYVWDIRDIKKVGKSHSFLYHSACIWGLEIFYQNDGIDGILPPGSFFTCSSDDTIRVWNLEPNMAQNTPLQRNIYCSELLKILYTDTDLTYLCNMDLNPSNNSNKTDNTYDGKNGVRCLKISPNSKHLASGDRAGNIRIYDLQSMELLCKIEAHDSEVLCLEYSKLNLNKQVKYLSSASRDCLIHIFDVEQDYNFLQTLDDHSSSVTSARFVQNDNHLQLVSCGADKTIIFRKAHYNPQVCFMKEHQVVGKSTFYDMEIDASDQNVIAACQDHNVRVYSVTNGKQNRCFLGSEGEEGTIIKVVMDTSGTLLATSSTDKNFYIYDYVTGEFVASMSGHSELVTGLKFSPNSKQIISVSGDGCIFVWKLGSKLTQNLMNGKPANQEPAMIGLWQNKKSAVAVTKPFQPIDCDENIKDFNNIGNDMNNENSPSYQFNIGQLPSWAKKQMTEELKPPSKTPEKNMSSLPVQPRGRWAQRLDGQALVVRSYLDTDSIIPIPNVQGQNYQNDETTIQYTIAESKSSLDIRGDMISQSKQLSVSRTTMRRGDTGWVIAPPGSKREREKERIRHSTDSSSASSLRADDGDAEDERSDSGATECSETIYYPQSEDTSEIGDSSFHVCESNDDSNGSKGRKLSKQDHLQNVSAVSTPDRLDLMSDEDESGTPVEGERSFVSNFSISTENLERLDMREKFMRSNYESLEKGPNELQKSYMPRHSITTKYLSNSPESSRAYPTGVSRCYQQGMNSPSKKREELTKALNDARKKLETLGWKGGLSTSKSVGDLRNYPDKESNEDKMSLEMSDDKDIRRSTSYSDLPSTMLTPRRKLPSTPHSFTGSQVSAPLWSQGKGRQTPVFDPNSNMSDLFQRSNMLRSASVGALNKSKDVISEEDQTDNQETPTSSPLKVIPASVPRNFPQSLHTLGKSSSSINLNSVGRTGNSTVPRKLSLTGLSRWQQQQQSDTSSSDASPTESKPNVLVPRGLVARRLKAFANDSSPVKSSVDAKSQNILSPERKYEPVKSKSEWDLCKLNEDSYHTPKKNFKEMKSELIKDKIFTPERLLIEEAFKENIKNLEVSPKDLPVRDKEPSDISTLHLNLPTVPLTQEICEKVSEELKRVTMSAMQVFQRVTVDPSLSAAEKSAMTTTLAQGVWQAQQNLRPAVPPLPYTSVPADVGSFGQNKQFPVPLPSEFAHQSSRSGTETQPPDVLNAMALLQQYSDKLLSIVEQRISKNSQDKK